ncbi:MAG: nitroreductase family protein [Candidatus Aenigmatarchaeota archaeon]
MNFYEALGTRHSVRSYSNKPVEEAKLKRVLEAANSAPSAGNLQAYEIFVVRGAEKKAALAEAAHGQGFIAAAPVALVFCAAPERSRKYGKRGAELYCVQDATIAAAYAWLAAVAEGLASVWVGAFDDSAVLKVLQTTSPGKPASATTLRPVAILPLGYPAEKAEASGRRPLDDIAHEV